MSFLVHVHCAIRHENVKKVITSNFSLFSSLLCKHRWQTQISHGFFDGIYDINSFSLNFPLQLIQIFLSLEKNEKVYCFTPSLFSTFSKQTHSSIKSLSIFFLKKDVYWCCYTFLRRNNKKHLSTLFRSNYTRVVLCTDKMPCMLD